MGQASSISKISKAKPGAEVAVAAPALSVAEVQAQIETMQRRTAGVTAKLAVLVAEKLEQLKRLPLEDYNALLDEVEKRVGDPGKMLEIIDRELDRLHGTKVAPAQPAQPGSAVIARKPEPKSPGQTPIPLHAALLRAGLTMILAMAVMFAIAYTMDPTLTKIMNGIVLGCTLEMLAMYVCEPAGATRTQKSVVLSVARAVGLYYMGDVLNGAVFKAIASSSAPGGSVLVLTDGASGSGGSLTIHRGGRDGDRHHWRRRLRLVRLQQSLVHCQVQGAV